MAAAPPQAGFSPHTPGEGPAPHPGSRGLSEPFRGRVMDGPGGGAPVVALTPHSQPAGHFRGARLGVFGAAGHRRWYR